MALDLSRLFHLTMLGTGVGTVVLVIAGSRTGAVVATLTAVLGGAIAAKLQWHNLVAAYAFLPWVLLPLVRRPRRPGVGSSPPGCSSGSRPGPAIPTPGS